MTVKRTAKKDLKTELKHLETGLSLYVGHPETWINRKDNNPGSMYVYTSREMFEALIELAQEAIKELDHIRNKEIERLEAEIKKLKGDTDV